MLRHEIKAGRDEAAKYDNHIVALEVEHRDGTRAPYLYISPADRLSECRKLLEMTFDLHIPGAARIVRQTWVRFDRAGPEMLDAISGLGCGYWELQRDGRYKQLPHLDDVRRSTA